MRQRGIMLLLGLCLLLGGCAGGEGPAETRSSSLFAMDTVMDLQVSGGPEDLLDRAEEEIRDLEALFSTTDPHSEIYALNRDGEARLSADTAELLNRGLALCRETEGALDLSVYPVVRAWGFTTEEYRIPDQEELEALLSHVDYRQIRLEGDQAALPQGMEIDLGSVAKGYTGDRLLALFREAGASSALLNLGGNVQALGAKPDGSPWRIAIQDPAGSAYLGVLSIQDQAVITSGGYERYFEGEDGQIYWHIMDPATGRPARKGLRSVTVVGDRGLRCDALSTALFILGTEGATEFWRSHQDFDLVLETEEGALLVTPGLAEAFQPGPGREGDVTFLEAG